MAGLATLVATALPASADAIFKGVRGPTEWQLDERVTYSTNDRNVTAFANTFILKYWDGKETGKWFFAIVPYKHIDAPNGEATGVGDITLGFGPRGTIGNTHFLTYGGITLPIGSTETIPALGTGRYDLKIGSSVTYLTPGKGFEIDGSLEYALTGENKQGVNPPNELAAGFVIGGKIGTFRTAAGLTGVVKTDGENKGDHAVNLRGILRYVASPKFHFEVIGDRTILNENMPKATSVTGIMRYNL